MKSPRYIDTMLYVKEIMLLSQADFLSNQHNIKDTLEAFSLRVKAKKIRDDFFKKYYKD